MMQKFDNDSNNVNHGRKRVPKRTGQPQQTSMSFDEFLAKYPQTLQPANKIAMKSILLVVEDPEYMSYIESTLKKPGRYEVYRAESYARATEALDSLHAAEHYDLVILDVRNKGELEVDGMVQKAKATNKKGPIMFLFLTKAEASKSWITLEPGDSKIDMHTLMTDGGPYRIDRAIRDWERIKKNTKDVEGKKEKGAHGDGNAEQGEWQGKQ